MTSVLIALVYELQTARVYIHKQFFYLFIYFIYLSVIYLMTLFL